MSLGELKWSGPAPGLAWRAEAHQHLAVGTELHDLVPALVPFRNPVRRHCIGHPDVAVGIDLDAVRPDEHAAAEAGHDFAVGTKLVDRIHLGIAAFIAKPGRIGQRLTSHDRPDMASVVIDVGLAHRSERPAAWKLSPAVDDAIRIRKRLSEESREAAEATGAGHRKPERCDHTNESCV